MGDLRAAEATTAPARSDNPRDGGARVGDVVDRYVLLEQIGAGAMGVVWAAHDRKLDRKVALKLLHDQFLGAPSQERLIREARAMAKLAHPNVVAVFDVGEKDHRTFIAMEFVRGQSLVEWLRETRSWREVVDVFHAAARGLAAAHAAGIVHRDVKPANILLGDDGRVRVADFGLSRDDPGAADPALRSPSGIPSTTGLVGSPAYMAPEQLRGERADARSDQFGLCVALHEALAGKHPFSAPTIDLRLAEIEGGPPAVGDAIPEWLARVAARGLAADPDQRFPSMAALADALGSRAVSRARIVALAGASAGVVTAIAIAAVILAERRRDARPSNEAVLDAARASVSREPARALAWLARLDPEGAGWDAARVIAADALSRPQLANAVALGTLIGDVQQRASRDPGRHLVWTASQLAVVDLTKDRVDLYEIPLTEQPQDVVYQMAAWYTCRDGARAVGLLRHDRNGVIRSSQAYELDLGSRAVTIHQGADAAIAAVGHCTDEERVFVEAGRVLWWDARGDRARTLVEHDGRGWSTADRRHAITVDPTGLVVWWEPDTNASVPIGTAPRAPVFTNGVPGISADGRVVAFPSVDLVTILRANGPAVPTNARATAVAVAHDGTWVATYGVREQDIGGTSEREIQIHTLADTSSPQQVTEPSDLRIIQVTDKITRLATSSDSRTILAIGDRTTLLDVVAGAAIELADTMHLTPATQLTGIADGMLRVWTIRHPPAAAIAGAVEARSPNGRWIVTRSLDGARRYDSTGELPVDRLANDTLAHARPDAIADDGSTLLRVANQAWLWRRNEAPRLLGELDASSRLMWSPSHVPRAIGETTIIEWPAPGRGRRIWTTSEPGQIIGMATPDLRYVAIGSPDSSRSLEPGHTSISLVDTTTSTSLAIPGARDPVQLSPDGSLLASAHSSGGILLWDIATRRARIVPKTGRLDTELVFSPDGRRVAAATTSALYVIDTETATMRTLPVRGPSWQGDLFFDGTGSRIVGKNGPPGILRTVLWDVRSGEHRTLPIDLDARDNVWFVGDRIELTTGTAIVTILDDLPRDPHACSAYLRGLPYELASGDGPMRIRR